MALTSNGEAKFRRTSGRQSRIERLLGLNHNRKKVFPLSLDQRIWWTMFLRFISAEVDEDSGVSMGLFCATEKLLDDVALHEYEYEALLDCIDWFTRHLRDPFRYRLEPERLAYQSICWFRSTAHEHLSRAWEMVALLEERDILMRMIKTEVPGYILYEDNAQVLAYPYADLRRLL